VIGLALGPRELGVGVLDQGVAALAHDAGGHGAEGRCDLPQAPVAPVVLSEVMHGSGRDDVVALRPRRVAVAQGQLGGPQQVGEVGLVLALAPLAGVHGGRVGQCRRDDGAVQGRCAARVARVVCDVVHEHPSVTTR